MLRIFRANLKMLIYLEHIHKKNINTKYPFVYKHYSTHLSQEGLMIDNCLKKFENSVNC